LGTGTTTEPEPQSIQLSEDWIVCHFVPESCDKKLVYNGDLPKEPVSAPATKENELCPSFAHAEMGQNPVLLISGDDEAVEWVLASGDKVTMALPVEDLPDPAIHVSTQLQSAQDHVLVTRRWYADNGFGQKVHHVVLTLVNIRTQELIWNRLNVGLFVQSTWLQDDGVVIFNKYEKFGHVMEFGVVVTAVDGTVVESLNFMAEGPQSDIDGVIPVRAHPSGTIGWWNPRVDEFAPVASQQDSGNVRLMRGHWVWLVEGKTTPLIRIAAPGQEATTAPVLGLPSDSSFFVTHVQDSGWLLLSDGMNDWRVELVSIDGQLHVKGAAVALNPELPEGMLEMDGCFGTSNTLDAEGRYLFFLRNDDSTAAYRYTVETHELEAIGIPVYGGMGGSITSAESTYHVHNYTMTQAFCMPPGWDPNFVGPAGPSHQVALPDAQTNFVLGGDQYSSTVVMHETGGCFVESQLDSKGRVTGYQVTDAYNGRQTSLSLLGHPQWIQ